MTREDRMVVPARKRQIVNRWLELNLPQQYFDAYTDLGEMSGWSLPRYITEDAAKRIELLWGPHGGTLARIWLAKHGNETQT